MAPYPYQDFAIAAAAADQDILTLLPLSFQDGPKNELAKMLLSISPGLSQGVDKPDATAIIQVFLSWCSNSLVVSPELYKAIRNRKATAMWHRLRKCRLIKRGNLDLQRRIDGPSPCQIPAETVKETLRPYPPLVSGCLKAKRSGNNGSMRWRKGSSQILGNPECRCLE